jgi:hypothetical protein
VFVQFASAHAFAETCASARQLAECGQCVVCARPRGFLQLPGSINNGDEIEAIHLKRMGELGIDFSIEVFPDM